jgi:hypothetical protein
MDKPLVALAPGQQNPAGTAAERLAHAGELRRPAIVASEVTFDGARERCDRRATFAEPSKCTSCRTMEFQANSSSRSSTKSQQQLPWPFSAARNQRRH